MVEYGIIDVQYFEVGAYYCNKILYPVKDCLYLFIPLAQLLFFNADGLPENIKDMVGLYSYMRGF